MGGLDTVMRMRNVLLDTLVFCLPNVSVSKFLISFLVLLSVLSIGLVRGQMHVLLALVVCRVNGQWRWEKQKYFSDYETAFL